MIMRENIPLFNRTGLSYVSQGDVYFSPGMYDLTSRQWRSREDPNFEKFEDLASCKFGELYDFRDWTKHVRGKITKGEYPVHELFESLKKDNDKRVAMIIAHGGNYKGKWAYCDEGDDSYNLIDDWVAEMDDTGRYFVLMIHSCNTDDFSVAEAKTPLIYPVTCLGSAFHDYSLKIQLPRITLRDKICKALQI